MIPDLCTWAYDLATRFLPPLPSLWPEEVSDEEGVVESPPEPEEVRPAPATTDALARARDALDQLQAESPPPDARFRAASASLLGGGAGIHRLVGRLEEIDVGQLAAHDREALMGAASNLVERLRRA